MSGLTSRLLAARVAGAAVALALAASPAAADEALDLYRKGLKSFEGGSCPEAARLFRAAIAKDSRESANKKDYGVVFEKYYPHYQLAKALQCAGDAAGALAAVDESRRQGVMRGSELQALRTQIEAKSASAEPPRGTPPPTPATAAADPKAEAQKAIDQANEAYRRNDLAGARAALNRALAVDPGNARAKQLLSQLGDADSDKEVERLLADAQRAVERKEYSIAKARADEALKLAPDNPKARSLVQNLAVLVATATPGTAPTAAPTSSVTPMTPAQRAATELSIGKQLIADGKLDEGITRLEAARRLDPSNLAILPVLADAQKKREQLASTNRAAALVEEARKLQAAGNLRDARARVEQAKNLDPASTDARQLADELARLIAAAAAPATPAAVDKTPLRNGVKLYFEGNYDEALRTLDAAKAQLSETPSYHFYLGAIAFTRYLLGGESDPALKQRAEAAFLDARRLGYQPDPGLHSPRIVAAFQTVR